MTIRLSTGLRNFLGAHGSLRTAFQNGRLYYYTGTQPSSADAAPTGTLLATFTASGGANTAETRATGTITLTGGASGSIDTLTINSIPIIGAAVAFDTSLSQTAANLAAAINRYEGPFKVHASASGAVVTLTAPRGSGTAVNTWAVAATLTTITASYVALAGGVAPVNGLTFEDAAAGVLAKLASQAWEATAAASGTAGWFRLVGSVADSLAADANAVEVRLDGSIGTSGANLNLTSTTITAAAVQTISAFQINVPAA